MGSANEAEAAIRAALAPWQDDTGAAPEAGRDFRGRVVAEACLGWLK